MVVHVFALLTVASVPTVAALAGALLAWRGGGKTRLPVFAALAAGIMFAEALHTTLEQSLSALCWTMFGLLAAWTHGCGHASLHAAHWMVAAKAAHAACDGACIGLAWNASRLAGAGAGLAVGLHQLPLDLAACATLMAAGMTARKSVALVVLAAVPGTLAVFASVAWGGGAWADGAIAAAVNGALLGLCLRLALDKCN